MLASTSSAIFLVRVLKTDLEGLAAAADVVRKGGLICYPTDTVYGLGCDPFNTSAIERAMRAKGERTKPMPILVKDLEDARRLAQFSKSAEKLACKFWPGPLTLIIRSLDVLPAILVPDGRMGLRSPKHAICLELLGLCGGALVGTSANPTGKPPATTAEAAAKELGDRVDLVLDGGRAPLGVSSTVVDLTSPKIIIMREGPIGRGEITRCLRKGT